jgi:hypothetical protein
VELGQPRGAGQGHPPREIESDRGAMGLSNAEERAIRAQIETLRMEHSDLNDVIDRLMEQPVVDQLQLQRMKKRKLALKDQILRLENMLIPDIIA